MEVISKPKKRTLRGFTLVELVATIIIIAIIAAAAYPRWITSPGLDAQTEQLLSNLRYAQFLAITHGSRFRLNFTLPSSYNITSIAGSAVSNPSTGSSTITLTGGVTITGLTNLPNNLVAFDETGSPYTNSTATTALGANAVITLQGDGVTRTITITQQTGSMVTQ